MSYSLYEMEMVGLLPLQVNILNDKQFATPIIKKDFDIFDWISEDIKKIFSVETINKAIKECSLSFKNVSKIYETSNLSYYIKENVPYSIFKKEVKTRTSKDVVTYYDVYGIYIPSALNQDKLFNACLLIDFPKLKELKISLELKPSCLSNIQDIQNSSVWLNELPEDLQNMTVKEILKLPSDYKIMYNKLPLDIYLEDGSSTDNFYFNVGENRSIGLNTDVVKTKDFETYENKTLQQHIKYQNDVCKKTLSDEDIAEYKKIFEDSKYLRFKEIIKEG